MVKELYNQIREQIPNPYQTNKLYKIEHEKFKQHFLGQMDFIKDILGNGINMDEFSSIRMSAQIEAGNILKNFRL